MKVIIFSMLLFSVICLPDSHAQNSSHTDKSEGPDYKRPVAFLERPDPVRVREIAAMLPDKPRGTGMPCHQREVWDSLRNSGKYAGVLSEAWKMLQATFPPFDEDVYMGFFTKGDSQSGKDILHSRLRWLIALTWAECLENKGTYVPLLEQVIEEILSQKTWVYPRNYSEKNYGSLVELSTASHAHNLAQALYLLDDKLSPQTRKKILESLYTRAFNPLRETLETLNEDHPWLTSTNNWNAVCLSGVTGAALTVIPGREERAGFVAIAEKYARNYMAGFLEDGYCSEGIAYFNYGFGHYILLRENIWQATGGKIDLFEPGRIREIAEFGPGMEITWGVYPTIADCRLDARPAENILYYLSRNLGLGQAKYDTLSLAGAVEDLKADVMYVFPNTASETTPAPDHQEGYAGLRSWFEQAGVLTVRPAKGSSCRMGAVLKGGNNGEHHNHNDLGSFTIAVGGEKLVEDPGIIPYTARTFGPERYTYKTLASYGHPVPLIAGQEQQPGAQARAVILRADFTRIRDRLDMDITSAYKVPELKKFVRKFTYSREGKGALQVEDEFEFTTPQTVESALTIRAAWERAGPGKILLKRGKEQLLATIHAPGAVSIRSEEISEEGSVPYTRLGIRLDQPILAGTIRITFSTP